MTMRLLGTYLMIALLAGACTQDPNVKKQQYLQRGIAYQAEGKYNEAIIQLKNALQIDPKFAPALHAIGRAYRAKSWSVDALRELHRAVELEPDNVAARVDLGQVYLDLEGWSAAIEQADAIRVRAQDSPGELYIRGVALNGLGNHAQAVPEGVWRLPRGARARRGCREGLQGSPRAAAQVWRGAGRAGKPAGPTGKARRRDRGAESSPGSRAAKP